MHDAILQAMAMRWWTVVVRRVPPLFITSDNPVTLYWGTLPPGAELPPFPHDSPGYGLPHTEVSVPLSRHVALVGTFERPPVAQVEATVPVVAVMNARTIRGARRSLASTTDEIVWQDEDGRIKGSDDLPATLRDLAERRAKAREEELAQLDRQIPLPE